jgi:PST family polysaccharide transporter
LSIRVKALKGGAYMALREGLGVGIRLAGMLVLTRLLGPSDFGLYAGAAAVTLVIVTLAQMGLEVYLIRQPGEPDEDAYDQAFTFLLLTSVAVCSLVLAFTWTLGPLVMDDRFMGPLRLMLISVPINILWVPGQAKLERAFDYRRLAFIQLTGDVALYAPAIALAAAGLGVTAPIVGEIVCQTWILVASFAFARYRPRLRLSRARAAAMMRFGASYSTASWLSRGEQLINPVVVGSVLGPAAVGVVALAQRLAEALGALMRASWKLSIVAFSKVQEDSTRLRRALEEAMGAQLLFIGPLLAVFATVAVWVVPAAFGDEWKDTLDVFPFLALHLAGVSLLSAQAAAFYARGRNGDVVTVNLTKFVVAFAAAAVLVPALGVKGYGVALLVSLASLLVSDWRIRRLVRPSYRRAGLWAAAFCPPMLSPLLEPDVAALLWLPTIVVLATPLARAELRQYAGLLRSALRRGPAQPDQGLASS